MNKFSFISISTYTAHNNDNCKTRLSTTAQPTNNRCEIAHGARFSYSYHNLSSDFERERI
jgi:hypothetical protein